MSNNNETIELAETIMAARPATSPFTVIYSDSYHCISAMEVPYIGCVIRTRSAAPGMGYDVNTGADQRYYSTEALQFIPGVRLQGRKITPYTMDELSSLMEEQSQHMSRKILG